jgi:hypothetical protein
MPTLSEQTLIKDPWELANRAAATEYIAQKIEEMNAIYQNVIAVADYFDVRVCTTLDWPEDIGNVGHNSSMKAEVFWNPSSKGC